MAKPDGSNITVYKADSYTKDTPFFAGSDNRC